MKRDREAWSAFVLQCPDATFFHRIEWRDLIEDVFHHRTHFLIAERAGAVVGVLPLARVTSLLFGDALVSMPFAVYGGAAVADEAVRAALHSAAADLARDLGVQHLEIRNRGAAEPEWPRQDLYVTFRKKLLPEVEANLLAIPRKQRAMVRKGIERGLVSEIDEGVGRFFELYADNQQRHGSPRVLTPLLRGAAQRVRTRLPGAHGARLLTGSGVLGRVVLFPGRSAAVLRRRPRARARVSRPTTSSTGS